MPPRSRARSTCSSASLIVPFRPSSRRSLKWAGSYSPSSSRTSVSVSAQISNSRCQSLEFRASRETSRPITIPARPRLTSVTKRWKPSRSAENLPDWPWSDVDDDHLIDRPAKCNGALAQIILTFGALRVLEHLTQRRLAHVEIGVPLEVSSLHFGVRIRSHVGPPMLSPRPWRPRYRSGCVPCSRAFAARMKSPGSQRGAAALPRRSSSTPPSLCA